MVGGESGLNRNRKQSHLVTHYSEQASKVDLLNQNLVQNT